jgi:hypothetical protein
MTNTSGVPAADPYDFVTVATSIIIGLGLTQVLNGVAKLIQLEAPGRLHWEHLAWVLIVAVLHVQVWWTTYNAHTIQWTFGRFARYLVTPTTLYLMADLLLPDKKPESAVYQSYFAGVSRPFFAVATAFCLSAWLDTARNHHQRPFAKPNVYRLLAALAILPAALTPNAPYRSGITVIASGILVLFLIARHGSEGRDGGEAEPS